MGHRRGQCAGGPGAVPVGKARAGHRTLAARGDRQADGPPGPADLLGAGRTRGHGNRCRPKSSAGPSPCTSCSICRCWLGGVITGVVSLLLLGIQRPARAASFSSGSSPACCSSSRSGSRPASSSRRRRPSDVLGGLVPRFHGTESVLLAAAILGATVMPHAVYLHSGLALDRHGHPDDGPHRRLLLRVTRWDVVLAMTVAGDGERGDAAGRRDQPAGPRRPAPPSRAPTPRFTTRWARPSRCCSRSDCSRRVWRRRRWAPTPAP